MMDHIPSTPPRLVISFFLSFSFNWAILYPYRYARGAGDSSQSCFTFLLPENAASQRMQTSKHLERSKPFADCFFFGAVNKKFSKSTLLADTNSRLPGSILDITLVLWILISSFLVAMIVRGPFLLLLILRLRNGLDK